jgi:hypothetical protein
MSAKKHAFSSRFNNALLITAMVEEMARADGWRGTEDCLAADPELIDAYTNYAQAALRALKGQSGHKFHHKH